MSTADDKTQESEFLREPEDYNIDTIDDAPDGYYDDDDSDYSYDAEAEWEESKAQMQALFSMVVFPYLGKFLGRKFSFWRKLPKKKRERSDVFRFICSFQCGPAILNRQGHGKPLLC
ncbi:hypothetical protein DM01DRAFT_1100745 [Hesseltinella vesiculosa]|uniref:Uncharacterized protein n=1 Tax=Hesseltinella vesiculosa TaxID=101127 RepID=A0A1X2GB71_9FUNG|nr:hypothetical protein DM01DRAFT_1100745 [Hesseltinella vesiculosa]